MPTGDSPWFIDAEAILSAPLHSNSYKRPRKTDARKLKSWINFP